MHRESREALSSWYEQYKDELKAVADMGSYDINGSVKEVIPYVVGFDICQGDNVDIVINNYVIAPEHLGVYDGVTALNSIQYCDNPSMFVWNLRRLLRVGGRCLLTSCGPDCKQRHTPSPGAKDCIRFSPEQLRILFQSRGFSKIEIQRLCDRPNDDIILRAISI